MMSMIRDTMINSDRDMRGQDKNHKINYKRKNKNKK